MIIPELVSRRRLLQSSHRACSWFIPHSISIPIPQQAHIAELHTPQLHSPGVKILIEPTIFAAIPVLPAYSSRLARLELLLSQEYSIASLHTSRLHTLITNGLGRTNQNPFTFHIIANPPR